MYEDPDEEADEMNEEFADLPSDDEYEEDYEEIYFYEEAKEPLSDDEFTWEEEGEL